jgi:hypothetical protein
MIASRRPELKLILLLCYAIILAFGTWLAILLLSQLALMEPVTAAAAQSLAGADDALRLAASSDASAAGSGYASARWWVWFCIGANAAGALLLGLWLRAAMSAPPAPARRPCAAAGPRASLIERAMRTAGPGGAQAGPRPLAQAMAHPAAGAALAGGGELSLRLARIARIIDTLAFQTTLLAVNAAVEAERGSRLPPQA